MTIGILLVLALVHGDTRPRLFIDQRGMDPAGQALAVAIRAQVQHQGHYRLAASRAEADLIVQMQTMTVPCDQGASIVGAQFLRTGSALAFVGSMLERVPAGKV